LVPFQLINCALIHFQGGQIITTLSEVVVILMKAFTSTAIPISDAVYEMVKAAIFMSVMPHPWFTLQ